MKIKTYRICLLSLVILMVVGGLFYYMNGMENSAQVMEGTFVVKMMNIPFVQTVERWISYGR